CARNTGEGNSHERDIAGSVSLDVW
nr:immunoglobulin heavy chain junction region [Macaca mulatta]